MWNWLGSNAGQIQALAGIAAVIVAAVVAWVAWKQKLAAEAQATAAKKQTKAAEVQAEAAREQVAAAKQQTATALLIADKQISPNIVVTAMTLSGAIVRKGIEVQNLGSGPAVNMNVQYNDGSVGNDDVKLPVKTLAPNDKMSFVISDEGRAARSGFRLFFETMFGTQYTLEFQWNGVISRAVNERWSVVSSR